MFKGEIIAAKPDGRAWDGLGKLPKLPTPDGLSSAAFAVKLAKMALEAGLEATAAPDPYVVLEVDGHRVQTATMQDTLEPIWGTESGQMTAMLHPGSLLQVSVFDQDLQESTKDTIGAVAHSVTADELRAGLISLSDVNQVRTLQIVVRPLATRPLVASPGHYRVTIVGATVSPKKPPGLAGAGHEWDGFGGLDPDVAGSVFVGDASVFLPMVSDSLQPMWNSEIEVDLDETSSLSVELTDKDLSDKTSDPVGAVGSDQLLAEIPGTDGLIHLTNHAAILDLSVRLTPVPMPVTASDCSALAAHVHDLALSAHDQQLEERTRTPTPEQLAKCVSHATRAQLDCSMRATTLAELSACK